MSSSLLRKCCCGGGFAPCTLCQVRCATVNVPQVQRSPDPNYSGSIAGEYVLPACGSPCVLRQSYCGRAADGPANALLVRANLGRGVLNRPDGSPWVYYTVGVAIALASERGDLDDCCTQLGTCLCDLPVPGDPIGQGFVLYSQKIIPAPLEPRDPEPGAPNQCPVNTTIALNGRRRDEVRFDPETGEPFVATVEVPEPAGNEIWAVTRDVDFTVRFDTGDCSVDPDCACSCRGRDCPVCGPPFTSEPVPTPAFLRIDFENLTICTGQDWPWSEVIGQIPQSILVRQDPTRPCTYIGSAGGFALRRHDGTEYPARITVEGGIDGWLVNGQLRLRNVVQLEPGQWYDCFGVQTYERYPADVGRTCGNQPPCDPPGGDCVQLGVLADGATATPVTDPNQCRAAPPPPPDCSVPCRTCGRTVEGPCVFCPDPGKTTMRLLGRVDYGICDNCDDGCPGIDCDGCCVPAGIDPTNCRQCGATDSRPAGAARAGGAGGAGPEAENCICDQLHGDRDSCLATGGTWCCHRGSGGTPGASTCDLITHDFDVELPLTSYTATTQTFELAIGPVHYRVVRYCNDDPNGLNGYQVTITLNGHCVARGSIGGGCASFSGTLNEFTDTELPDPEEFPCQLANGHAAGFITNRGCD